MSKTWRTSLPFLISWKPRWGDLQQSRAGPGEPWSPLDSGVISAAAAAAATHDAAAPPCWHTAPRQTSGGDGRRRTLRFSLSLSLFCIFSPGLMKQWHLREMKPTRRHVLLLWMLVCSGLTEAIEPISTSIAVGMAAALTGFLASYQNILHYFHECCRPQWISFNRTGKNGLTQLASTLFIFYGYLESGF